VISMYKWHQVKLLKAKGTSIKEITRQLKLSKNTVKKYLRSSHPPQFKVRQKKKILDSFESEVKEMLSKGFIGTRIYNELIKQGYSGSLPTVHRQIAMMKKQEKIAAKVTTRVETAPGQQMQYDWKEWTLPMGEKKVKIYIHQVILSYSRMKYYAYSLTIGSEDIIRAIEEAIHFFGGSATELLLDNAKQMVIIHKKNGVVGYNEKFLLFCGLYGIEPSACQSYRARTKGKVENPFYYIQEHLLRGLEVKGFSELTDLLTTFRTHSNARIHSALKQAPEERFVEEKESLTSIPSFEPTILYPLLPRKVSNDGYISYCGLLYPVSMDYCLKDVFIEPVFGRKIRIYDNSRHLVGEHEVRMDDKALRPPHPEHDQKNQEFKEKKEKKRSKIVQKFVEIFGEIGTVYMEGLKEKAGANLYWHLDEIMSYTTVCTVDAIGTVLSECIEIGAYHKNTVKRLLMSRLKPCPLEASQSPQGACSVDIKRALSEYKVEE
jgi:transposase